MVGWGDGFVGKHVGGGKLFEYIFGGFFCQGHEGHVVPNGELDDAGEEEVVCASQY